MNNIVGKWKINKLTAIDKDFNLSLMPVEEAVKTSMWAHFPKMAEAIYEFTPEGRMELTMPIPEGISKEDIEKEGLQLKDNGYGVFQSTSWKEENGGILYKGSEHKEIFGEEVSPWEKIGIDGNIATLYEGETVTCEIERIQLQ